MALLGSYAQVNLWFLLSMTLTFNCLSQMSLWTKGTHTQSCVHMGRTYKHICPVQAIVSYLATQDNYSGQVFTLPDGRMLTRAQNLKILRKLDLQTHQYNTYSFRIGAATSAKQAGIANVLIKTLG